MRRELSLALLFIFAIGCDDGGASSEPADCAWLASDNCWKQQLTSVPGCAPGDEVTGVLSADLTTCTYEDGTVINFEIPVSLDFEADVDWDFEIVKDGATCMSFKSTNGEMGGEIGLTTVDGTFRGDASQAGLSFTCADGSRFSTSDPFALLMCDDAFQTLPGTQASAFSGGGQDQVTLNLNGGADGDVPIFKCETAPAEE